MQTQFTSNRLPVQKPISFSSRPAQAFGTQRPQAPGRNVQFSGALTELPGRFVRFIVAVLTLGMVKLERKAPEAMLTLEQDELVRKVEAAKGELSKAEGEYAVTKQEVAQLRKIYEKENLEFESSLDAYQEAQGLLGKDPQVTEQLLQSLQEKVFAEKEQAEKALEDLKAKEEEVAIAEGQALDAKETAERLDVELKAALKKLETAKRDAKTIAAKQRLLAVQQLNDQMRGQAVGLSGSAGTLARELAVEKASLDARLGGGRTAEQRAAHRLADQFTKKNLQAKEMEALLAARTAKKSGTAAPAEAAAAAGGGDDIDSVKPGS